LKVKNTKLRSKVRTSPATRSLLIVAVAVAALWIVEAAWHIVFCRGEPSVDKNSNGDDADGEKERAPFHAACPLGPNIGMAHGRRGVSLRAPRAKCHAGACPLQTRVRPRFCA
jgi:hypothetical protein